MKGQKTMEPRYRVRIDFPDGTYHEQGNVNKIETQLGVDGKEKLVTYDDAKPTNYPLHSGIRVTITDWDVDEWLKDYPAQEK